MGGNNKKYVWLRGGIKMNLRWYQTYDKDGVNSEEILQQYNARYEHWENIPFIREREPQEEDEDG